MKRSRRLLAGAAALAALSLAASSCDSSPYAASVNSHVIKQTALNVELGNWAGNTVYVSAVESAVSVQGTAPGTYDKAWVASVLDEMIGAAVVHQHLAATGNLPGSDALAAARSVAEVSQVGWGSFSPDFRDTLVPRLADVAAATPPGADQASIAAYYRQNQKYFFTQICTRQASAFAIASAEQIVSSGEVGGTTTCYSQGDFEGQSAAFQKAVLDLSAGEIASPIQTSYGYLVVQLVSRAEQALTPVVGRTISVVLQAQSGVLNETLAGLLAKAHVQVNPEYGTWKTDQVVPPAAPKLGS
ncbi:MAG: foldase protein PrsA [Acidimicrobiales bacterium]